MGNVHLVTGYAGYEHITAADQGAYNAAMIGRGQYVLGTGKKLAATAVTNNQVRVYDGDIMMQGRYIRLNEGAFVDLVIENGSQGFMRNDLIVARYTKDAQTGVEDVNLVVIQGTASASSPVDPDHVVGDIINNHDILNEMPLYRVPIDGLAVQELVPLFTAANRSIQDVIADMDRINKMNPDALLRSGGTMRGSLILASDPAEDQEAATKIYVDTAIKSAIDVAIGGDY